MTTDPITGIHDGILKRPATDPLVFQVDSATEFWQLRASLNVVDGPGKPVPIRRTCGCTSTRAPAHGFDARAACSRRRRARLAALRESRRRPAIAEVARALLVAMDAWADRGIEPPPSNYPRVDDGTLVPLDEARAAFPAIPGARDFRSS